jgi:glycosyltransferase involved in cell wall biosynthesis
VKILMLSHEFPPVGGGASPVVRELAVQLVRTGHSVDVVTMHYGDLPRVEEFHGVNVYRTRAIRGRPDICYTHELATYMPGALPRTLALARRREYDIIHCHFLVPGGPLAWIVGCLRKIPYLVTCHGSDVPGYNPDRFKLMHALLRPAWRRIVHSTPLLTSPSSSLRDLILRWAPQARVTVIPNGICAERFAAGPKEKRIVMCSRILPRKGFQYAIAALRDLELDWKVDVIGEGPYLPELRRLAEGARIPIRFWGWLDKGDPRFQTLFREGAIFVFPSEAENFPSVLLEALAAGMAIISSDAGGSPEVVGDAGVLVKPRDTGAIRDSVLRLTQSSQERIRLSEAALVRVRQFSWESIADRYVACYRDVIDAERTRRG